MAETRTSRFSEMQIVLRKADDEFAANLRLCVRSVLFYRLVLSSNRKVEFNFLFDTSKSVLEEGNSKAVNIADAMYDLTSIHEGNPERESTARILSAVADVLDKMRPKELYRFISRLRKEPIHYLASYTTN